MTTFETGTDLGGVITAAADADATTPKPLAANEETDFDSMKVAALKELCKAKGQKHSGTKAELIARLVNPVSIVNDTVYVGPVDPRSEEELTALSVDDLKQLCADYGCSKSGNKAQLVEKIMNPGEHQIKKGKKRALEPSLEIEAVPLAEKLPLGEGLPSPPMVPAVLADGPDFAPVPEAVQGDDDPAAENSPAPAVLAGDDVEEEPEA